MSLIKTNWPALSDFFDDDWIKRRFTNDGWMPAINVVDNKENYEVEVAAPGFNKEDFNVTIENGVLTITGKTETEEEETNKNYTRREFTLNSFTKSFTLPENIDQDSIEANHENGILRLMLKKTEKALPPKKEVVIS